MRTKRIKIEDVEVGMKIKTMDKSGNTVFKTITDKFKTEVPSERQRKLTFENGTTFRCSNTHPIMVKGNKEKYPDRLTKDDLIVTESGYTRLVKIENLDIDSTFYDISVDGTETFFASDKIDSDMVLSHNCSQGGVRGASATVHFPWFHYEFGDLVVLKNNKGTEETRERHMDYSVQWNGYFLNNLARTENREISFFCPKDTPDLFDAFYAGDDEEFGRLYEMYEKDESVRRTTIPDARTVLDTYLKEFMGTGRIYSQNMSAAVNQGPFTEITGRNYRLSSNLCQEIALLIKEFDLEDLDQDGLIALCTLSSINWGVVNKVEDLEEPCRLSVRALDNLLTYQDYPVKQAERFTRWFRALGIGIVGLAHFLAKRDLSYGFDALETVDEYMEAMTYYLTDESVRLAEERGPCEKYEDTCYAKGVFPFERRNKNIDKLVPMTYRFDWEELRGRMKKYGIRNATLMAIAPTETSSQLAGETNGIEMPVEKVTSKSSKDGILKLVVPEVQKLKNKYTYRWDMKSPRGYLMVMGVLQKWVDQSISVNMHYNPENYEDGQVPMSVLMKDFMFAWELGLKNLYYCNTLDQGGEEEDAPLEQVEIEEEICEACVI